MLRKGGAALLGGGVVLVALFVFALVFSDRHANDQRYLGMGAFTLGWFLVAVGATALLVGSPFYRKGLTGYIAVALSWLGVWAVSVNLAAYYQYHEFQAAALADRFTYQYGLPWASGFEYLPGLFLGATMLFMGIALARSRLVRPGFALTGTVIGALWLLFAVLRFLHVPFAIALYWPMIPLAFIWVLLLGVLATRNSRGQVAGARGPVRAGV